MFNKQMGKLFNRKKPLAVTESTVTDGAVASPAIQDLDLSGAEAAAQAKVEEATVLESYPLNAPYAYVQVTRDTARGNITYVVEEPKVSKTDMANIKRLKGILNEVLEYKPKELKSKQAAGQYLVRKCSEIFDQYNFKLTTETRQKLLYYVVRDNLGFGKIDSLMHDPLIEDISCDGVNVPLYIWHRKFESIPTNLRFETAEELDTYALRLAYLCGSHVSIAQPMLDASLPDGSRINLTFGSEVTRKGSTFTIRKFKLDPFTVTDLVAFNSLSPEMAAFFWYRGGKQGFNLGGWRDSCWKNHLAELPEHVH